MKYYILILSILFFSCQTEEKVDPTIISNKPYFTVLGIAQDAGYPQVGCEKECCQRVIENSDLKRRVVALGLVDPSTGERWLFEATPDFREQYNELMRIEPKIDTLSGIFLTHAHIGHYTGLMQLGREVMGTKNVPVFAMPKMRRFLYSNGPWRQLTALNNIKINKLTADSTIVLNEKLSVKPLLVPHRDEFSETVGFIIQSKEKSLLFIPDIDKWSKWNRDILALIRQVDYAFLDATFYKNGEIKGRDMSEIPHPFVEESITLFNNLSKSDKAKVYFIHFNHTNPLLNHNSTAHQNVTNNGFFVAKEGQKIIL
ncbi:MAG: MBL fold metallo-hydrolase [Saprospiraceae bacterium]